MSRFYKTDRGRGNFDIDFTYRPPWELAQMALATQQQGYDDMLKASTLFDNIDIKHIGTEQEKQAVNNITQSYTDRANTIANQMQGDKNNWRKYSRELRTLQRDLQKDMSTGNIASIQKNYAQMQDYMKRNEELRKTDPRRYEAAMAEAMGRFNSSLGGDTWSQQDMLKGPDFDAILKEINDLKSNKSKRVQKNPNGRGYIIDNSYEVDELTPERIAQYAASRLMSDPSNMQWARQTQDWGLGTGYFNEDGSMVNMFTENEVVGTDAQGNPITKKMLGINPESGFSPFLNSAIQKAFRDESIGESWSADATYNAAMGRQNSLNIAAMNNDAALQRDLFKYEHAKNMKEVDMKFQLDLEKAKNDRATAAALQKQKYEWEYKAANGDIGAQQLLNQTNGAALAYTAGTKDISVTDMINGKNDGDPRLSTAYTLANSYALDKAGKTISTMVGDNLGIKVIEDAINTGVPEDAAYYNVATQSLGLSGAYLQGEVAPVRIYDTKKHISDNYTIDAQINSVQESYEQEITLQEYLNYPSRYDSSTVPKTWKDIGNRINTLKREKEIYDKGLENYVNDVYNKSQMQSLASTLSVQGNYEVLQTMKNYSQNHQYIDLSDTDKGPSQLDPELLEEATIIGMDTNTSYGSIGVLVDVETAKGTKRLMIYPDGTSQGNKLSSSYYNMGNKYMNNEDARKALVSAEVIKLGSIFSTPTAEGQTITENVPIIESGVTSNLIVSKTGNQLKVESEYLSGPAYPNNLYEVHQLKEKIRANIETLSRMQKGKEIINTFEKTNPFGDPSFRGESEFTFTGTADNYSKEWKKLNN